MTVILKRTVTKETAMILMEAINKVTVAENLLRKKGRWLFSIKPKEEIPTMSMWFQFLFYKDIQDIS